MTSNDNLAWRKSSYSGLAENCVEVAHDEDTVAVRDSKHPNAGTLCLTPTSFARLVDRLR